MRQPYGQRMCRHVFLSANVFATRRLPSARNGISATNSSLRSSRHGQMFLSRDDLPTRLRLPEPLRPVVRQGAALRSAPQRGRPVDRGYCPVKRVMMDCIGGVGTLVT